MIVHLVYLVMIVHLVHIVSPELRLTNPQLCSPVGCCIKTFGNLCKFSCYVELVSNNAKYLCLEQVMSSYRPQHQLILPQEPNKKIFEEKEKFCVHSSFSSTDIHLVKAQCFLERVDQKEISVQ